VGTEKSRSGGFPPPLLVQAEGQGRSLPGNRSYLVGRDPRCDIVVTDDRVSWHHAALQPQGDRWVLVDNASTNGTYAHDGRRVARIEIGAECVARLGHPADGPVLRCTVTGAGQGTPAGPAAHPGTGAAARDATDVLPAQGPGPEPASPPGGTPPGKTLRIGRAPDNDIVVLDPGVSRHHAELRNVAGRYRIVDLASHNGTFVNGQRATDTPLSEGDVVGVGPARFRLAGHELRRLAGTEADAPPAAAAPPAPPRAEGPTPPPGRAGAAQAQPPAAAPPAPPPSSIVEPPPAAATPPSPAAQAPSPALAPAAPPPSPAARARGDAPATAAAGDGTPIEIPYAVRWLVPNGERFANFDILNDNDTQLSYYRRFGHIYAVGIPARKWRLVVVSDPGLLDDVAGDEEQFGKRVEDINFFDQLRNSRGGGISVISDGEHYERIRRVMLPWYSPMHQRTQLEVMKEQARKLVAAWSAIPHDQPLDARAWMERYTLEVSGRGACRYNFGLLDGNGAPHPFAAAVPESTKESIRRVAEPRPDFTVFAGRERRERKKRYRRQRDELYATAGGLVRARLHTHPAGQQTDLLSRLVTTPDPETGELLDTGTIRDQVLMHLSNGFNGPSITGAWLPHVIGAHPDVEEKLIAEIDQITGGDPDYDLQYDDLMALSYTTQVIKETMRIYPPMPVTIRRSLKDGTLGRYRIRKGDIILVGTLAAQRDPRYWGPDSGRFDPDQFAPDKVLDRPRHAFIPFSIGKRQCMAQEVTFMMLRVVLFEIYKRYRLRLAPGATVTKNTVVTTKPAEVPIIRVPREPRGPHRARPARATPQDQASRPAQARPPAPGWGRPTEIPRTSAYRHLVIAYGSNFGANKELAERFATRSHFHGYTSDVMTLNELAESPPRTQPWLLAVMTSTYTSNPPANAAAFKTWLERTAPGGPAWRACRYLVWGLGNSQWNAFLAFPRYVHGKLSELGATPLAELAYGDVGTPVWERLHAEWNSRVWPVLLELSGARPTDAAAARDAAEKATARALTGAYSSAAMQRSLRVGEAAGPGAPARDRSAPSIMRRMTSGVWRRPGSPAGPAGRGSGQSRVLLAPAILTNAAGIDTVEAHVLAHRELLAGESPKRARHLELGLPPGFAYQVGDHLGVCPKNDQEQVERLAQHLGAALDSLFMVPTAMNIRAAPKGVVLQVRNVLTSLVDITGRPAVALLDLMLEKVTGPAERSRLAEIRDVLAEPEGPGSLLRATIDSGGYDLLGLLEGFPSCSLNIFELLQVAQPLRPRYYSTSSSPRMHGGGVAHLTIGLEATHVPGMPTRTFHGMSSHYLHTIRDGDRLNVFHNGADGFHLQEDVTKPMIFVSAGTGFAPMRAFLWERAAMKRAGIGMAEAALFNGIRSASLDYIYRDEIEQFAAEGVLDHVHLATSREPPGCHDYVQDRIRQQGALVWRLLDAGSYVYVCGSQPMRDAVRAAFADVAAERGALSHEGAAAYVDELEATARYRPDLWG
jgi:cytochrome P450/NADPH-cytochrome P450 reductase